MTQARTLVAMVLTKNEEANIEACLASIPDEANIIVIDSESTDRTPEICRDFGAEIVQFRWNGVYPKKKEWATNLAAERGYNWLLLLDADERIPPALADEIRQAIEIDNAHGNAYAAYLRYAFGGRVLRFGFKPWKIILFVPGSASWPRPDDLHVRHMWEVEGHYQVLVPGLVRSFSTELLHEDEDDLYSLIARHNRYSDWEAGITWLGGVSEIGSGVGLRGLARRIWRRFPFKGAFSFLHSYVMKGGAADGSAGFDYAVFRLFYYWQIQAKKRETARRRGRTRS